MNKTFTPEYEKLQKAFHQQRSDYGISGSKYASQIEKLAQRIGTKDILDYGAGKGTLQKNLPYPIQQYDPFIEDFKTRPQPAQLVVCTDVLEHIEPDCLENVLADIASLTLTLAFFQIATGPASKFLPDGRNAHLLQEPINWWLMQLIPHFQITAVQEMPAGFICICYPGKK